MKAKWLILIVAAIIGVVILAGFLSGGLPAERPAQAGECVGGQCDVGGFFDRWRRRRADPEPTPEPTPPDPQPEPTPPVPPPPPPVPGKTLSAVGIWSALAAPAKLAAAAHSHEVAAFLQSQNGSWRVLDPVMLDQKTPVPAWVKPWFDAAIKAGKKAPCVIWHDQGKILAIDQADDSTTEATVLAWMRRCVQGTSQSVTVRGQVRACGLKPRTVKAGAAGFLQLSAKLQPLKPDQYPTCDLSNQVKLVRNQGSWGTCASQAGASIADCVRLIQFGPENFRPLSAFNLAVQVDGLNGAQLSDVMRALVKNGACTMEEHPEGQTRMPADWKTEAAYNKALAVYDTPDSDDLLGYVAAALDRGWPVSVGIMVGGGYDTDEAGYITYRRGAGGGGHAQVILGMRQSGGTVWLLALNSWGKEWGGGRDAPAGMGWIESTFVERSPFNDIWTLTTMSVAPNDSGHAPVTESLPVKAKGGDGAKLKSIIEIPITVEVQEAPADCPNGRCNTVGPGLFRRGR